MIDDVDDVPPRRHNLGGSGARSQSLSRSLSRDGDKKTLSDESKERWTPKEFFHHWHSLHKNTHKLRDTAGGLFVF